MIKIKKLSETSKTLKDKISDFLYDFPPLVFIKRVGRFILRLHRWIPILWNQEEWDSLYIYDIIKLKMKELRDNISKDTWHAESEVKKELKQLDICAARMDRYLNWTDYCDYPIDDIRFEDDPNNTFLKVMIHDNPKNEEQRKKALSFEEDNFNKFWQDFVKWHRNWWT